ncbi:M20 aminoacylase family protein [Roseicyclus sp. F158]|uniref:M20 aminoacylase family protein n=1 Tax=Tropicimonas omnivorans TaxID=3075590 RepID=A0ABU3DGR5_9RHOB|nr:M20 aminoacylase family protein [Roseicyclus sp. F158]MDT0682910.1 M20 aminoacylase family protein [Roseicyclus sp. F158]
MAPIRNRIAELQDEIAAWRRDFHANPELLFDVHRTAGIVAGKLEEFGCDEVTKGIGGTGVVAVIEGRGPGRTIGLRADMDALPITEATGVPHASTAPGVMHACGHDGHTAMLLGAARYLSETRNFDGRIVLIFQPAEEGGGGGREMCEDGLMTRWGIEEVYGMHNWPGVPLGTFAIRAGPFFAATDQFEIEVVGKGAHAAKPHEGVDPVVAASHLVLAIQSIASRHADPVEQLVVSVTAIESFSKAFNVIPPRVSLRGTVRTMSREMRALARERLDEICAHVPAAFGARADVTHLDGYPVMANHPGETVFAAEAATAVSGDCAEAPLVMGGEDFAYMLEERPGAYILLGNGDTAPVHHPEYEFDDAAIPMGVSWWVEVAERRLGRQ